jgi:hypothetical protein
MEIEEEASVNMGKESLIKRTIQNDYPKEPER